MIYVASRASIPERSQMWRGLRDAGWPIISSWIDEAGEGETEDFGELWSRIVKEISDADVLILYAQQDDFPLKGALLECGIAMGLGKKIIVCLPDVNLEDRSMRPIGSWIKHPNVVRVDSIVQARWKLQKIA